ncbi:hypothetical protein QBC34DRAFT_171894 [Podospora aff. communis PSN243]|uniref:C2H2-type domain-containing protein n=1 Tax=Podospora aff. communis PSN243 TaxID=3040156 RepID=A0AAV9H1R9_9PEZI|nr:hypothetical protein QBC34DRAFT_171894 [Podospora aff. communis PSN243]
MVNFRFEGADPPTAWSTDSVSDLVFDLDGEYTNQQTDAQLDGTINPALLSMDPSNYGQFVGDYSVDYGLEDQPLPNTSESLYDDIEVFTPESHDQSPISSVFDNENVQTSSEASPLADHVLDVVGDLDAGYTPSAIFDREISASVAGHASGSRTQGVASATFHCDENDCDKRFTRAEDRDRHHRTMHRSDGKYQCGCGKFRTTRKDNFRRHLNSKRGCTTCARPHTCGNCGWKVIGKDAMLDHIGKCGTQRPGRKPAVQRE